MTWHFRDPPNDARRTTWMPTLVLLYHPSPYITINTYTTKQTHTMMNVIRATRSARVSLRAPAVSHTPVFFRFRSGGGRLPAGGWSFLYLEALGKPSYATVTTRS